MIERNAPSRAATVGGGIAAVAGLAVALTLHAQAFTPLDWTLTLFGALAMYFVGVDALPVRGLRLRRTGLAAEALFLDLPVVAALYMLGDPVGPIAGVIAYGLGFGAASFVRDRDGIADLPRHAVLRILVLLALLFFDIDLLAPVRALPQAQYVLGTGAAALAVALIFPFCVSAPVTSLTFRISIVRLWDRLARDRRTWLLAFVTPLWVIVEGAETIAGREFMVIALWAPVCICAYMARKIDRQYAEVHRLRLVRDAVQAMLGDRDPLPQINAILSALRVQAFDETVSVLAATSARTDAWRVVTTLGPALSSAGDGLGRRILARMKFSGSPYTSVGDEFYTAYAFAARSADGELHGALTVHRRKDRPLNHEQIAQFTNAAAELAPLLRDMRRIAATHSAATIDALTGLANRAATMDRLQAMLDAAAATENGAILLLDIDHFKSINDHLGHAAGDECLRRIGEIVRSTVRAGDSGGRIGGEEFLIVMPGASREIALAVGERLRLSVALGGMRYANGDPVTTSIGVTTAKAGDTIETILARADRGLYEAKRQGRNCIVDDLESA